MKIELDKNGGVESISSDFLPYLTLIRNEKEFIQFSGWHHYLDEPTFPCFGLEIEHRCNSDYYYFTIEELKELLKILETPNVV